MARARPPGRQHGTALAVAALGVVFGDIGTSPLYALRECLRPGHGLPVTEDTVLGVLSLLIWSLLLIVSGKYVAFVMRADNRGEGGILALLALIPPPARRPLVVALGLFGAGTFLGPKNPSAEKDQPYECGSESSGGNHIKLSVKFYLTAILFVVFDIEAIFIYPWAVQFKALGWTGFATMLSFLVVLVVGLVYCWKKGALEWEK